MNKSRFVGAWGGISTLALCVLLAEAAWCGRTFYVSTTGNNSNAGTLAQPWATPGYGSRQLQPGDTLIILGGTYRLRQFDDDIISPQVSGTAIDWITIQGEIGNRPVLAGGDNLICAVDFGGVSYLRIQNLEITSDNGAAFRDAMECLDAPSSHVILEDLYIHQVDEFGMNFADVSYLEIRNCRITYCGFGAIGGPPGQHGGWRNVVISGCTLAYSGHYYQGTFDNPANPYDRPDGFGIEPSSGPVEIYNTTAEHNRGDGLDSKAQNTYIHECIVSNNSCDGVKLWGTGSKVENCLIYGRGDGSTTVTPWSPVVIHTEQPHSTFELVNVTVDDAFGENYIMHVQYDSPTVPITLTIRNSIFSGRGPECPIFFAHAVAPVVEYNLFYFPNNAGLVLNHGDRSYDSSELAALGAGNKYGDPLFVSPAFGTNGDYHLLPGSPALDAGTATGAPSKDLEGHSRPQGDGVDMGAYEKLLVNGPDIVVSPSSWTFGLVGVGSSSRKVFTVTNAGNQDLQLGTLSVATGTTDFRLENDNCSGQTIVAGANRTFEVVFAPTAAGAREGRISIPSNDPDTPTLNLELAGSGTTPTLIHLQLNPVSSAGARVVAVLNNKKTVKATIGADGTVNLDIPPGRSVTQLTIVRTFTRSERQAISENGLSGTLQFGGKAVSRASVRLLPRQRKGPSATDSDGFFSFTARQAGSPRSLTIVKKKP